MEPSVVVPAFDEAGNPGRTLESLRGQDAGVIVVAGGSDGTAGVAAAHPDVDRVVVAEGEGASAARNRGAEVATGDVLLFTDADTVVPPDWVDRHRAHYDREPVGQVGQAADVPVEAPDVRPDHRQVGSRPEGERPPPTARRIGARTPRTVRGPSARASIQSSATPATAATPEGGRARTPRRRRRSRRPRTARR